MAIAMALALAWSSAIATGDNVPAWKKPLPGTAARLGDDGGGEEMATICDTPEHFREWLDYGHPPGCKRFLHGLRVVIEGVIHDPAKDTMPGSTVSLPLVKIQIPSKRFTGYLQLFGEIHPDIPHGVRIHLKREGNATLRLAPSRDADFNSGPDLGEQATAKVVRYDPSTGDRDLYVTAEDGEWTGKSGWVFSLEARGDDGNPIDEFAQSVLEIPRPPKVDRMARLYVIQKEIRAFKDKRVCEAGMSAISNDQTFKMLQGAFSRREYYDFPAGTELHIVADDDTNSAFVIAGDSEGHQGCVSRYALPGYEGP